LTRCSALVGVVAGHLGSVTENMLSERLTGALARRLSATKSKHKIAKSKTT
jgi:translation initiation factor 2 gamma subunit (eIF-2gamma)